NSAAPDAKFGEVMAFLHQLQPISRHPLAKPNGIQGFEEDEIYSVTDLIECFEECQRAGQLAQIKCAINAPAGTFYHCPASARRTAQARMYLNSRIAASRYQSRAGTYLRPDRVCVLRQRQSRPYTSAVTVATQMSRWVIISVCLLSRRPE